MFPKETLRNLLLSDNAGLMAVHYNAWKLHFTTVVGNLFTGKEDSTNMAVGGARRCGPWWPGLPAQPGGPAR
jgi:hypothetical protein